MLTDKIKQDPSIKLTKIKPDLALLNSIKTVYDIIFFAEASSNLSNLTGIGFGNRQSGESWEEIIKNTRSNGFGFMIQRRLALGSFYLERGNQQDIFLRACKLQTKPQHLVLTNRCFFH